LKIEIDVYEWDNEAKRSNQVKKQIEITEAELMTAIINESIGYASPEHALIHIRDFKRGEKKAYCERAYCLFNCDLEEIIKRAVYYWYRCNDEQKTKLRQFAEKWKQIEENDHIKSTSISMLYPTLNL